ncbi:MAG: prolyl oligopeptidase family serine peptidase, partial [Rikenellaceae bacterium]
SLYVIYAKEHNLYMRGNKNKGADTTEVQLTTDGTPYRSYSKYPTEEDEFTAPNGRWLKNSKQFIITMEDYTKCDMMHLVDMTSSARPKLKSYKYSCPDDENICIYTLHLLDIATKKMTYINLDKWKDQYVEYAYDSKNGERLYFYRTKRTWDEKELCLYNSVTKEVKVLFNEKDEPFFDYMIAQTHFINDGAEFIYRSERTGYGHFYLYDGFTGKLKKALDTLKRDIYFYGMGREPKIDPYYFMLYRVNLDNGKLDLLTPENASHKVFFSKSNKVIVDTYSRVDMEPVTVIRNHAGKVILTLEKPDLREIYALGWRAPERFKVKSADGVTDLYGVMWKPMDFDSTKHYPIISEVYPGPQFEYVPTTFELKDSYATKLAQLGFIVIQVGHRGGTPMRGKYYHRQSYKNMRDYALADDKAAITELARRHNFINVNKVGIYGHSGGGFMSTAALCYYPNFYTAAVSSAGNHDNRIYNTGWIEMNNGVEEIVKVVKDSINGDKESVKFKSAPIQTNMDLAKNYKGHLLLVHGMMDDNVHPAHTFRMAKALMKAGKNFDMILLPESTHGFRSEETTFFERKMWRYFAKYLLNDASGDYQSDLNKFDEKIK